MVRKHEKIHYDDGIYDDDEHYKLLLIERRAVTFKYSHLHADHTARHASASVAGGLGSGIAAASEIVHSGVDNNGPAEYGLGVNQRGDPISDADNGHAIRAAFNVAEIADVPHGVARAAVLLAVGIVVAKGASAAAAEVTGIVNVKAILLAGVEARHVASDNQTIARLHQRDVAGHIVAAVVRSEIGGRCRGAGVAGSAARTSAGAAELPQAAAEKQH